MTCQFRWPIKLSLSLSCFYTTAHLKCIRGGFQIADFQKSFMCWREVSSSFYNYCTRYIHSGCLSANAMYGVFVITAPNSWNLILPRSYGRPVNKADFFIHLWLYLLGFTDGVFQKSRFDIRSTNLDSRMGNRIGEFSLLFIADVGLKSLFETI